MIIEKNITHTKNNMQIEPPNLGIPLSKKRLSSIWFVFYCITIAAIGTKASTLSQWIIAIFVVAPSLWIVFSGSILTHKWQNKLNPLFRILVFIFHIIFLFVIFLYAIPLIEIFLNSIFTSFGILYE